MTPSTHYGKPKLPAKQLAILAIVRFAEPLALTSVFPYLPEMIKSFGVPEMDVAKWAGLVGSTFSVSQSLCAIFWGRLSDKIGRKPTILIGLVNVMFCFLLWGTSRTLVQAFIARFLMGLGNGNVGIIRTMVAEMVPWKELQPKAFSLMPLVWSIGSVFGPSFGGFFARPVEQYPRLFGNSWLFKRYPFLLPNLVAFVFFFISIVVATLFLHETLETKRGERDWGLKLGEKISRSFKKRPRHPYEQPHRASLVDAEASAPLLPKSGANGVMMKKKESADTSQPTMREIFDPQVTITIIAYTFLALHSVAFDQVLPAFLDYPRQVPNGENTHLPFHFSGGFGLNSSDIGKIYTVYGLVCGIIQIFLFPPVCNRFGALNCFKAGTILFPIVYIIIPYTALIQDPTLQFAALLLILLFKGFAVIVGFPCITILLTNSAPSLRILGTLNGFATTFSGIGRAIGPMSAGATFTWGVKRGYVIPAFWLLSIIAIGQVIPAWMIVEGEGIVRAEDSEDEALLGGEDDDTDDERDRTIIAGDAADLHGIREDVIIPEPEDDEFPPLARVHSRASRGNGGYGTVSGSLRGTRLRPMSSDGKDLGRAGDSAR